MAEFTQSPASRQALQRASMQYLSQALGVGPREVQRYRAFLTGQAQQQRNPARAFGRLQPVTLTVKGDFAVGDDDAYLREQKTMTADLEPSFFLDVLTDPDEGWQTFFDSYIIPAGTIENVSVIRFT